MECCTEWFQQHPLYNWISVRMWGSCTYDWWMVVPYHYLYHRCIMKKLALEEWLRCNFFVPPRKKQLTRGWQVSNIFGIFTPKIGEDEPNLTCAYFSDGLVQPPTSWTFFCFMLPNGCVLSLKKQNWGNLRYALGLPSTGFWVPKRRRKTQRKMGMVFSPKCPKGIPSSELTYPPDGWHIWRWWFSELPQVGYVNFLEGRLTSHFWFWKCY